MKYPRHSFAPDSLLRPCRAVLCSIHEGGRRARGTVIRTVRPRRFNSTCMYHTYARTRAVTTDIMPLLSIASTSLGCTRCSRIFHYKYNCIIKIYYVHFTLIFCVIVSFFLQEERIRNLNRTLDHLILLYNYFVQ